MKNQLKKDFEIRFKTSNSKKEFIELILSKSKNSKTFIFNTIFFQGISLFLIDLKNDLSNLDYNLEMINKWVNGERYDNEIKMFVNNLIGGKIKNE